MNKANFLNSKAYRIWNELADGLIVNLLFVVTCIPIITYGPAKTALYETSVKWVKCHDGGAKKYWESFKANLKTSIWPGIVILILGVVVYLDYRVGVTKPAFRILGYILTVFLYMLKEQLFLFNARISCRLWQLIENGMKMTIKYPLKSLAGSALWLVPVFVLFNSPAWFLRLAALWVFAYFSFSAWIMTKLMHKDYKLIFRTIRLENDNRSEVMDDDLV